MSVTNKEKNFISAVVYLHNDGAQAVRFFKALNAVLDQHFEQYELVAVDGIGGVLAQAWMDYFASEKNNLAVDHLLQELTIEEEQAEASDARFEGMTFVITGSVEHFANRKELQELIESKGGKASGSVTSKTAYLINNDTTSNSSKNKKAKELGIPIISEKEFLNML